MFIGNIEKAVTKSQPWGFWRTQDGRLAVVSVAEYGEVILLKGFVLNDRKWHPMTWLEGSPIHMTDPGAALKDYIGTDWPASEKPAEKKWRPWTAEESLKHMHCWFGDYTSVDKFLGVTGYNMITGGLRIGCQWYSPADLLEKCCWRESPNHPMQKCGVEE